MNVALGNAFVHLVAEVHCRKNTFGTRIFLHDGGIYHTHPDHITTCPDELNITNFPRISLGRFVALKCVDGIDGYSSYTHAISVSISTHGTYASVLFDGICTVCSAHVVVHKLKYDPFIVNFDNHGKPCNAHWSHTISIHHTLSDSSAEAHIQVSDHVVKLQDTSLNFSHQVVGIADPGDTGSELSEDHTHSRYDDVTHDWVIDVHIAGTFPVHELNFIHLTLVQSIITFHHTVDDHVIVAILPTHHAGAQLQTRVSVLKVRSNHAKLKVSHPVRDTVLSKNVFAERVYAVITVLLWFF